MFAQQLVNGLVIGAVYALAALGYSHGLWDDPHDELCPWRHPDVRNIPDPDIHPCRAAFLSGAAGWDANRYAGGLIVARLAYMPLLDRPRNALVLTSVGASFFLVNLAQLICGASVRPFPRPGNVQSITFTRLAAWSSPIFKSSSWSSVCSPWRVLTFFVRYTRLGIAMRATSANMTAARLMGIPARFIVYITFAIGSLMAVLGGVLIAIYYNSVWPTMGFKIGLAAFSASILGGIGSLPGAVLGSFLDWSGRIAGRGIHFIWLPGWRGFCHPDHYPAGAPVGFAWAAGSRKHLAESVPMNIKIAYRTNPRQPSSRNQKVCPASFGVFLYWLLPWLSSSVYYRHLLILCSGLYHPDSQPEPDHGLYRTASLGHAAFYGIGAYTFSLLVLKTRTPYWVAFIAGGLMAAVLAGFLGTIVLRLKGHYLAIVTLAFGEIVRVTLYNWVSLTRGPMGLTDIPRPSIFSYTFKGAIPYYYLALLLAFIDVIVLRQLIYSRFGRAFIAIRDEENGCHSHGHPHDQHESAGFHRWVVLRRAGRQLPGRLYPLISIRIISPPGNR